MNRSIIPGFIKVAAIVASLPRWAIALMAADGLIIPAEWTWVHVVSGLFGAATTILEGLATAYCLTAAAKARGKQLWSMVILIVFMLATFIVVLSPSIYSRATGLSVASTMNSGGLWLWSVCIAASTLATVGAVGYAEAINQDESFRAAVQAAVDNAFREGQLQSEQVVNQWRQVADQRQLELDGLRASCSEWQSEADRLRGWAQELQDQLSTLREEKENDVELSGAVDKTVDRLKSLYAVDGNLSQAVAATILGISRQAVSKHLKNLSESGEIENNGHGVIIKAVRLTEQSDG